MNDKYVAQILRRFARMHTCKYCQEHRFCMFQDNGDEDLCDRVPYDLNRFLTYLEGEF